jgi:hypothetical protein
MASRTWEQRRPAWSGRAEGRSLVQNLFAMMIGTEGYPKMYCVIRLREYSKWPIENGMQHPVDRKVEQDRKKATKHFSIINTFEDMVLEAKNIT